MSARRQQIAGYADATTRTVPEQILISKGSPDGKGCAETIINRLPQGHAGVNRVSCFPNATSKPRRRLGQLVPKCLRACPVGTTPIVAWHEVPGKASLEKPSRRVRSDWAQLIPKGISGPNVRRVFELSSLQSSDRRPHPHECTNHTVPYGTALWGGPVPGTSCPATIAPSLRDISQQPSS